MATGRTTFWIEIDSLPEVSFLELWIHSKPGQHAPDRRWSGVRQHFAVAVGPVGGLHQRCGFGRRCESGLVRSTQRLPRTP